MKMGQNLLDEKSYGTFVRIDFLETKDGFVFGEFAPTPRKGEGFTQFANAYLGEMWDECFPDRL